MTTRPYGAEFLPGVGGAWARRVRLARWAGAVARDVEAGLTMRATAWIVDAANEADAEASESLAAVQASLAAVAEERDRLRAALAEAADELARSWRATAPAGRSRAHARGEGTAEAPGAADGQWGSGAPGGGQ